METHIRDLIPTEPFVASFKTVITACEEPTKRPTSIIRGVVRICKKLVSVYLSFGLRGRYFTIVFFVREVVESALQTTQVF